MKPLLYLETTIPSYLTSKPSRDLIVAARQQITQDWWLKRRHDFQVFVSQIVFDEAAAGDRQAAAARLSTACTFCSRGTVRTWPTRRYSRLLTLSVQSRDTSALLFARQPSC